MGEYNPEIENKGKMPSAELARRQDLDSLEVYPVASF
jgi:hypothetical protein